MQTSFLDSFRGKRIFLTGHTGFKGSWLSLWLEKLGAKVTGYALDPPTDPNHFQLAKIADGLAQDHRGDLCDRERLLDAISAASPELVLHLAAQSVVRTGYESPYDTFQTNIMGTASLLEAIRHLKHRCAVLCVTSDKCYENVEQVWGYRETDRFGDHDPYGGSKGAAEIVIRSYQKSFFPPHRVREHGVALASARAGNVVGGGDWKAHALLSDAFRSLEAGRPIPLRNPNAIRPWQHVLQCLSGYLAIADRLMSHEAEAFCSGWNIGPLPGSELSVSQVIDTFIKEWGGGQWNDVSRPDQRREAGILRLCIDKAIWQLNWKPIWEVHETIRYTAQWYRQYVATPRDMRSYSLGQIHDFEQAMSCMKPDVPQQIDVT